MIKNLIGLLGLLVLCQPSATWAGELRLDVPQENDLQQNVQELINKKQFPQALALWTDAFQGSAFYRSPTGKAAYSYVLFKSGLETFAVEQMFSIQRPQGIEGNWKAAWSQAAPPYHPVWKSAKLHWNSRTKRMFPSIYASHERTPTVLTVRSKRELSRQQKALGHSGYGQDLRAFSQKQLALWQAVLNRPTSSINQLDRLSENEYQSIDWNRLYLNRARVLYQLGQYPEALQSYAQVRKGSDYWVEAVEESAWAHVRLKRPDRALGKIKSLFAPLFAKQVGPEPFFLAAYINLKICDYSSAYDNIGAFKKTFKKRLPALKRLAEHGGTKEARRAVARLVKGPYSLKALGPTLGDLPRLFHRDIYVKHHILRRRAYLKEWRRGRKLSQRHDNWGSERLLERLSQRAQDSEIAIYQRLKFLADQELKEFRQNLQKLHLVEAEIITRLPRISNKKKRKAIKPDKIASNSDTLTFPVTKEFWVDELDHYHVAVKDCPPFGG